MSAAFETTLMKMLIKVDRSASVTLHLDKATELGVGRSTGLGVGGSTGLGVGGTTGLAVSTDGDPEGAPEGFFLWLVPPSVSPRGSR